MVSAQNGMVWTFHGPFSYVVFALMAGISLYLVYRKWQRSRRHEPGDDDFGIKG